MSRYKIDEFTNNSNAFGYSYEKEIMPNETRLLKMPRVTPNKRGVNDVGFAAENGIELYATLSANPNNDKQALWQRINNFDEINKTSSYLKIINTSENPKRINIRAIMC